MRLTQRAYKQIRSLPMTVGVIRMLCEILLTPANARLGKGTSTLFADHDIAHANISGYGG